MTPELPIIELPITAYDLIRALNECITLYSPKKVAFIGNYTALAEADELGNFVNCDIKSYHSESTDGITRAIDQAVADGYTAFIGGSVSYTHLDVYKRQTQSSGLGCNGKPLKLDTDNQHKHQTQIKCRRGKAYEGQKHA